MSFRVPDQIFHIPMEERAYKHSPFGQPQNDQNKVCLDIMKVTDTKIEVSTCRDGSLSLLVSGRADQVLKARREIYNRLQTQVRMHVSAYFSCCGNNGCSSSLKPPICRCFQISCKPNCVRVVLSSRAVLLLGGILDACYVSLLEPCWLDFSFRWDILVIYPQ